MSPSGTDENGASAFGADPEKMDELLRLGLNGSGHSEQESEPTASMGSFIDGPGSQIGRYKLLHVLGEGGMGVVYLAEQKQPIRRQVALKVIKPGMDSKRVIARFEAERQALALLEHPNIAHVLDAGTTKAGRPYFVMEYVQGSPITEYCDRHKLTVEDRLALFLQLCRAVHHAHQKGIIHRDIKPSNVLVFTRDDQPVPKIIDFGISKATSWPLTENTVFTADTQMLGTPEYMSPEQADMANEDIDTRSDIYSLGVLLYVLLAGVLPFDPATFRKGGIDQLRKAIREDDPKTPSTRLTGLGEEAVKVAASRRTQVPALARRLRKELEWIPLKAMRKDRTQRYQSAAEFAADIENYLNGDPLIAGPPSALYKLGKFMHRHRALMTGAAVVLVVLIVGIVVSAVFAVKADRQADTLQEVLDLLRNGLLASASPYAAGQPGSTLESVLDITVKEIESRPQKPLVESLIRATLGTVYSQLGKWPAAESNLKRAIELRRKVLDADDLETFMCLRELGWLYTNQGMNDQAEPILVEAVDGLRTVLDEADQRLLEAISRLAWVYWRMGQTTSNETDRTLLYERAERLQFDALQVVRRKLGREHRCAPNHMEGLAAAYEKQGRLEEAEKMCREALRISHLTREPQNSETINIANYLGELRQELGQYDDAKDLYDEVLEVRRRRLGGTHPKTIKTIRHLASLYREMKDFPNANQLLSDALEEIALEPSGPGRIGEIFVMFDLAEVCADQSQYDKAESWLLKANDTANREFPNDQLTINVTVYKLMKFYESQNRPDEAKKWRVKLPVPPKNLLGCKKGTRVTPCLAVR